MRDSLKMDGDDASDMILAIEHVFVIRIPRVDLERCETLGDLHESVKRQLPAAGGGRACGTAMSFHRLRRALMELSSIERPTPHTPLKTLAGRRFRFLKKLEAQSGLSMPPHKTLTWIGGLGLAGTVASVALAIASSYWTAALMTAASILAIVLDPGVLVTKKTLGDLAIKVSAWNFPALAEAGARTGDRELWQALTLIVSDCSAISPDEMHPATTILPPARKRAA
jgi:hypothetical protein